MRRSREGAWIEIYISATNTVWERVAPVRERGLKLKSVIGIKRARGRSREGAWIEIYRYFREPAPRGGRSREGAWIEILAK